MTRTVSGVLAALSLGVAVIGWGTIASAQRQVPDPVMRIWGGVYSDAQAARGETAFTTTCGSCHRADLTGARGPALAGPKFMAKWELESLNQMFHQIKDNMPRDNSGSLADAAALDLVAFILKANGFPAATAPTTTLTADEELLDGIVFVPREGPTKIPNFALVQVAGCLTRRADGAWALTRASEPLSTKDVPATEAELRDATGKIPGAQTFRLVSAGPFGPESHRGQAVHVKGIINRIQPDALLNVTALQPLGGTCGD
jgi:mono/diheme cytochrome c family protein